MTTTFSPGSLVRARGREWIVLTGSTAETIKVRPLSGSEEDTTWLNLGIEPVPVTEATFPQPSPQQKSGHDGALLLRDALLLSMRRGAGPFRGFGQISVTPRAYQLVPLLMALKQDTVRLLIADDVGVGKTIEAALIARELIDRGDVERVAVLCPPHLVDQWVTELENRFHLHAVAVTASSATRLERGLPPTESIFTQYPYTVVSLDYIKSDRRRADFVRACPHFVIVDEAHTCAATGQGRHQRYSLLKELAAEPSRHLVLLTATPHSGDDAAFYRLLGLLDPAFANIESAVGEERTKLRERLGLHFVQRRRPDIAEWKEGSIFPDRQTGELTYKLTGEWERFFEAVLDYCASVVESASGDGKRQRLNFWGTLALMRCVASSPHAALRALRTRAGVEETEAEDDLQDRLFDGASDSLTEDDIEPPAASEDPALKALIASAEKLVGQAGDPKLKLVSDHVEKLLAEGFAPVVFCRYIATAEYLGEHLAKRLPKVNVSVITGQLASEERRAAIEDVDGNHPRLLVATDCLSEGINLQDKFDAVVHYDLSWNPTRHEQREGRVDRYGQQSPTVRATLIYGNNNPVDGAVLDVILRKAERIRRELGVPVPLPDDNHQLTQALLKAVLLRHRRDTTQGTLDLALGDESQKIETTWESAKQKAKESRTVFAQRRLRPEDVLPEFHRTLAAVGGDEDVKRFAERALSRLGAGVEPLPKRGGRVALKGLPDDVRERLEAEGLEGTLRIDFAYPPAAGCRAVQRSHPLVSVLAETLLERTLASLGDETTPLPGVLGRVGCWVSPAVNERTVVTLLRLRHQLVSTRAGRSTTLLVEECSSVAWRGAQSITLAADIDALELLKPAPVGDPPASARERMVTQALEQLTARRKEIDGWAEARAQVLLADHRRVREAAAARGSYAVKALLPVDIIGLFVLLPKVG